MTDELHFEDWSATYGSPYLEDAAAPEAEFAEPPSTSGRGRGA
jgi:hypothetical protein